MPLTPTATRDPLARLGHEPKRFLGQNFLIDGNIVRKSLELAEVSLDDHIIEIGPGLGTLTAALLLAPELTAWVVGGLILTRVSLGIAKWGFVAWLVRRLKRQHG